MNTLANYRLVYMGTPEISAKTFESLIQSGLHFVGLIAQEDKEVGRKKVLTPVPTKVVAEKYHIPVFQPHRIREDYMFVKDLKPDLILTFAYGQIIPKGLLEIPKHGCFNLHGSLLPKYRGAAPIQRAIMSGESKTGITLMAMVEKMDAGMMYAKEEVTITDDDNYSTLANKLSEAASKVTLNNIEGLLTGTLNGVEQIESEATLAPKILPEEEHIDLSLPAVNQVNYIRALSETPGAYLYLGDEKFKILKAKVYQMGKRYDLGHIAVTSGSLVYQAPDALIEIILIQPAGKKVMSVKDYINGHPGIIGQNFQ